MHVSPFAVVDGLGLAILVDLGEIDLGLFPLALHGHAVGVLAREVLITGFVVALAVVHRFVNTAWILGHPGAPSQWLLLPA